MRPFQLPGLLALVLTLSSSAAPTPFERRATNLGEKLFSPHTNQAACIEVSRDLKGNVKNLDKGLSKALRDTLKAIATTDAPLLDKHLHRKIATGNMALEMLLSINNAFGKPVEASVARVWAINPADTRASVACPGEPLEVFPIYGYTPQFAVWIDLMGGQELGRFLMILVPTMEDWRIGFMSMHRWTLGGKDFEAIAREAEEFQSRKDFLPAWILWDLSAKLLAGNLHFTWTRHTTALARRDAVGTPETFTREIASLLPGHQLTQATSALTAEGPALVVRLRLPPKTKGDKTRAICHKIGQQFLKESWFKPLSGIRCSYNSEGEPLDREGKLGGLYLSREALTKGEKP
jgi:hypothetical protein